MAKQTRGARHVVWLGEAAANDPFTVGGKAASLSRLATRHSVPPGFVLTTAAFEQRVDPSSDGSGSAVLILPAPLCASVVDAYRSLAARCRLDDPAVAVRSSAVDEDGGDASFAGQHETFLNVTGAAAVVDAIQRCWRSFTAPHAIEYRRRQGLPTTGVRVAILVQQLVIADAAAVAFSADPVTGARDVVLINANWGLGESIVGGTVTPDAYVVHRHVLSVTHREIVEKRCLTVALSGGTAEVDTPAFLRQKPALTDAQAMAVARLALALEAENGHAVDVECAFSAGQLYLLQCRPITTLAPTPAPPPPSLTPAPSDMSTRVYPSAGEEHGQQIEPPPDFPVTWEHSDDEHLLWTLDRVHWPDPMPPLVFAVAGDALARGLTAAGQAYELPIADVRVQRINTYRYQASIPLTCSPREAQARRLRSDERLRAAMGSLRATWTGMWLPEVQTYLAAWDRFDLTSAPLPALLGHLDETLARMLRLWEIHFLLASPMHGAISSLGRLYQELFGGSLVTTYQLLQGAENRTLLAGRALWYLSRLAASHPEIRAPLESSENVLESLGQTAYGRDFLVELRSYLTEFGQRGDSLYFDRPSWADDPTPVLEQIRGLVRREDRDVAGELVASWDQRDELVRQTRRRLAGYPAPIRDEFEFLLSAAQDAVSLTEDHNFWIDAHAVQRVRRVFLECGRRLATLGVLAAQDDVFFLTVADLRASLADADAIDQRALVAERRAEMTRFRTVNPPTELGTRPAKNLPRANHQESAHLVLKGHGASAGRAQGIARVLRSLGEAGRLAPGEVLVTGSLSSSWTPLFATAAAVVTDAGGILSHAAVVAREYRLPAVLGAASATSEIRDGDLVEVDGDRGEVRLLAGATAWWEPGQSTKHADPPREVP